MRRVNREGSLKRFVQPVEQPDAGEGGRCGGQTAVSLGIVLAKPQLAMTGSGYQGMVPRLVF
jgi:hypothetical protein